jgi:TolA-binding protein
LLLDSLDHQQQPDLLAQWVEKMRASRKLLDHRPELAHTLVGIHVQLLRLRAEREEKTATDGDKDGYSKCAATYLEAFAFDPTYRQRDELLYNAGCCLAAAGDQVQAARRFEEVIKTFPKSALVPKARERAAAAKKRL